MKKVIVVAALCILGSSMLAGAHPASADVRINANVSTGHFYLDSQPNVVLVPGTQVYYTPYGSDEVYQYRNRWFVNRDGMWYRASSYRGPFIEVPDDRVPRQVISVPVDYRQQFRSQQYRASTSNGWRDRHHHHHHYMDNDNYNNDNDNNYRHHRD